MNKYLETGTIFRKGDTLDASGNDVTHGVRSIVAEHRRSLEGPHGAMAGKRVTNLPDGTTIITWVNPYGLVPTLISQVITPTPEKEKETYSGIIAFIPAQGDSVYPGSGPIPFNIETGAYYQNNRDTFASPYVTGGGAKINGLLGTSYPTVIYGVEGDHRYEKPDECGWLVTYSHETKNYTATRAHPGYFGVQNWFGLSAPYENTMDILSWDGPHSRYSFDSYFAVVTRGDHIYHRMKVLIELSTLDAVALREIMGAGIEHTEAGDVLRIIAAYPDGAAKIVAYQIGLVTVDGEPGDYFDKYYEVDGTLDILDEIDLESEFTEEEVSYLWTIRTGFYFNASGTNGVCTIWSSSEKTYLYHFDSIAGFSRELVFDAAEHTIGDGAFPKIPGSFGGEDVVPQLAVVQEWFDSQYGVTDIRSPSASTSWTGTVRLLSERQIVCADYVGDELVYLYYTNPVTEHTRLYSHQWSASFWNWLDPNGYPSPINVAGKLSSHKAQTNHVIITGDRTFESSDGKTYWSGGTTTSSQIVEGTIWDEGDNISPDVYIPPRIDVTTDPTHPPMYRYYENVWNGWVYDNPTACVGQRKEYTINFLDLRYGIFCLVENYLLEEADVYWEKSRDELEQTYHETVTKKFILVDGRQVIAEPEFYRTERDVPIGLGSYYGLDYWFHIEETFFIANSTNEPIDVYGLRHPLVEFRGFASQDGYPGTLLALRNGEDLIYTLPLGWDGTDLVQLTSWAGDTNPQLTFFEGDVGSHYIANLAFV